MLRTKVAQGVCPSPQSLQNETPPSESFERSADPCWDHEGRSCPNLPLYVGTHTHTHIHTLTHIHSCTYSRKLTLTLMHTHMYTFLFTRSHESECESVWWWNIYEVCVCGVCLCASLKRPKKDSGVCSLPYASEGGSLTMSPAANKAPCGFLCGCLDPNLGS